MTLKNLKDDFAQGYRRFARGSGNGTGLFDRLSGPPATLTNRKQSGEDSFQLPEDGFIHLVPIGEFKLKHRQGDEVIEIIQVVDEEATQSILNSFEKELLLNYDHFAHRLDRESKAAGWIQELEKRPDGIYGRVRWTNSGKRDVTGGEYRFVSPEFDAADTQALGNWRYRILRLDGAALTNSPNMKTLTPLSNRRDNDPTHQTKMNEKLLNRLRRFFGLSEDADENAILNAVPADKTHTQLQEANTTLTNRNAELLGQLADKELEGYDLEDADRKQLREGLIANRDSTLAIMKASKLKASPPEKLFNRESAKAPDGQPGEKDARKAEILAGKIANRADEIYNDGAGRVSWHDAFKQAQSELEETK